MKDKLLEDYIQTVWNQDKPIPVIPLDIRNAAIDQAHLERSLALVRFKIDFLRWFKSKGRADRIRRCDQSQCSI